MGYVRAHAHSVDSVTGYRVRLTVRDGKSLVGKELVIVAAVEGAANYLHALDTARAHRTSLYKTGERARRVLSESESDRAKLRDLPIGSYVRMVDYACVDPVYADGCIWGDDDYEREVST